MARIDKLIALNSTMRILAFSSQTGGMNEEFNRMLQANSCVSDVEKYHAIDKLAHRLRRPGVQDGIDMIILHVKNRQELATFVEMRKTVMRNFRIILILPERREDIVDLGHRLRPRYMGVAEEGLDDVAQVLKKMSRVTVSSFFN